MIGKSIAIRWADSESYLGRDVTFYTTIEVIDGNIATLKDDVSKDQAITSGYIFHDNSVAFKHACDVASTTEKSYVIDLEGKTYVVPDVLEFRDFSQGAPLFINGTLKIFREEVALPHHTGVFDFLNVDHLSPYKFGFENVNVIPRDCYDYNLEDYTYLVKFPAQGEPVIDTHFVLNSSNSQLERGLYDTEIRELLQNRGAEESDLDTLQDYYFPFASQSYMKCGSLADATLEFRNNVLGRCRNYAVQISLFNKRRGIKLIEENNTIHGVHTTGRLGLLSDSNVLASCSAMEVGGLSDDFDEREIYSVAPKVEPLSTSNIKALCNITEDRDGIFRVLTISENSPIPFSFNDLASQYDQYFWKRTKVSCKFKTSVDDAEKVLFVRNTKPYESKGVYLGTVKSINEDVVTIDKADTYNDYTDGYGERPAGVIKYDSIIGDLGETLENVKANNLDSLIDLDGQARDYRGICISGGADLGETIEIVVEGSFIVGENLYAWDLGTGDAGGAGDGPIVYQGNSVLLPKYLAYDQAYTDIEIEYFYYSLSTETHHIYTDGFADISVTDCEVVDTNMSQFVRDKGDGASVNTSREFVRTETNGKPIQNTSRGITVIDGMTYRVGFKIYGTIHTYNHPTITGNVEGEIIDMDGSGYELG